MWIKTECGLLNLAQVERIYLRESEGDEEYEYGSKRTGYYAGWAIFVDGWEQLHFETKEAADACLNKLAEKLEAEKLDQENGNDIGDRVFRRNRRRIYPVRGGSGNGRRKMIKFRGKTPNDKIVYGLPSFHKNNWFINDCRVETDSIAQFCGFDSNGDEVYEGDTVTAHGKSYIVELKPKYGLFNNLEKAQLQS